MPEGKYKEMWEAVYKQCIKDGDTEEVAARKAWEAIKKAGYKPEEKSDIPAPVQSSEIIYAVQLADGDEKHQSWIEGFRLGSWVHRVYGKITATAQMFETIIRNFRDGVVGRELVVDYQHSTDDVSVSPENRGKAAGWIKDIKILGDRLMLLVEWTDKAAAAIKAKEWRYFSPTYDPEYRNRENGKPVGVTLLGGALTNTPFLTGLEPINLSDLPSWSADDLSGQTVKEETQNHNNEEQMRKVSELSPELLKIWTGAYDAAAGDEVAKVAAAWEAVAAEEAKPKDEPPAEKEENKEAAPKKPEDEDKVKAELAEAQAQVEALKAKLAEREMEAKLSELAKPHNGYALPPAVVEQARVLLKAGGKAVKLSDGVTVSGYDDGAIALLSMVKQMGLVKLSEEAETKSRKLADISISEADRKAMPGASDESILIRKFTDAEFHKLPVEHQTADNYRRLMNEAVAKLNEINKE